MFKKILVGIGVLILLLLVWQYELVTYGLGQAKGQIKVIWNARPVYDILRDPQVPDSLKQKIRLAQEVREFAIDSLGVNDSDSYRSLYDQRGQPILWVVTACEPLSMKDKKWAFPILGEFSYKGFFDYDKALQERDALDTAGYDTNIRTVSAWSTLGILDDPLMSGLLFRSEGELANTIVHELTHATLFVRNNLRFNENLASFVGNQGAAEFLKYKYGDNSSEYTYYIDHLADRRQFAEHMLAGVGRLDSLYQSFPEDWSMKQKQERKRQEIRAILQEAKQLGFKNQRYQKLLDRLLREENLPNNTFFKSYVRYQGELGSLENEFRESYDSDIRDFLVHLKQKYGK